MEARALGNNVTMVTYSIISNKCTIQKEQIKGLVEDYCISFRVRNSLLRQGSKYLLPGQKLGSKSQVLASKNQSMFEKLLTKAFLLQLMIYTDQSLVF